MILGELQAYGEKEAERYIADMRVAGLCTSCQGYGQLPALVHADDEDPCAVECTDCDGTGFEALL